MFLEGLWWIVLPLKWDGSKINTSLWISHDSFRGPRSWSLRPFTPPLLWETIHPHRAVAIAAMDCHRLENSVAIAVPSVAVSHQRRCVVVYHSSLVKTLRQIHHSAATAMRPATVPPQRRALSCNMLAARGIGGEYIPAPLFWYSEMDGRRRTHVDEVY